MLSLEQAVEKTLASVARLEPEFVVLNEAYRRYAAQNLHAKVSLPSFDNSAMDGYAVISSDLKGASEKKPTSLHKIGVVPAGDGPDKKITPGCCMRIFTGSPIPKGANAVVMQESCEINTNENRVICADEVKPWENIRMKGEDVQTGDQLLTKGQKINTGALGLLAATGHHQIKVGRQPNVGIISTGNELVEAPKKLTTGKIYDSNRTMLSSLVSRSNGVPKIYPIVPDNLEETCSALKTAFQENDIILSSGGVSVGDHDHVKPAIEQIGGTIDIWKVSIKPGKPFVLGQVNDRALFGLPGNPASALVTFQLLVLPALLKMQGASDCRLAKRRGELTEEFANKGDRRHFVRVSINSQGQVVSTGGQRSHMLGSLAKANALLDVPPASRLTKGDLVEVLMIED